MERWPSFHSQSFGSTTTYMCAESVGRFGLHKFRRLVLPDLILGRYPCIPYLVGCRLDDPPPPTAREVLHEITLGHRLSTVSNCTYRASDYSRTVASRITDRQSTKSLSERPALGQSDCGIYIHESPAPVKTINPGLAPRDASPMRCPLCGKKEPLGLGQSRPTGQGRSATALPQEPAATAGGRGFRDGPKVPFLPTDQRGRSTPDSGPPGGQGDFRLGREAVNRASTASPRRIDTRFHVTIRPHKGYVRHGQVGRPSSSPKTKLDVRKTAP
jgi:hypothetical protein